MLEATERVVVGRASQHDPAVVGATALDVGAADRAVGTIEQHRPVVATCHGSPPTPRPY